MRLGWNCFRRLAQLLFFLLLLLLIGCGSTFRVSGALNASNASGTVSFVHLTAIFDNSGTLVNVTIVTLAVPSMTNTFTFCGNQTSLFTMNSTVQVSFIPGSSTCSNLVSVVSH